MPGRPARRVFHAGKAEAERAMRCPDGITGQSHYFERTLGRLIPEAQRADAEAGKAVPAGQEAADAVACNAHGEADAADRSRLERLQVEGPRLKNAREAAAMGRLLEEFINVYRRASDATMTNQLCFDLFFRTGLPD